MPRDKVITGTPLFTPEALRIAYSAFDACLKEIEASQPSDQKARARFQVGVAQAILRAVAAGEQDIDVLKTIGLRSIRKLAGESEMP
jgi:hypothetical protein